MASEITSRRKFERTGGEEVTLELAAADRIRVFTVDGAEIWIQWDGEERAEVILNAGKATFYTP